MHPRYGSTKSVIWISKPFISQGIKHLSSPRWICPPAGWNVRGGFWPIWISFRIKELIAYGMCFRTIAEQTNSNLYYTRLLHIMMMISIYSSHDITTAKKKKGIEKIASLFPCNAKIFSTYSLNWLIRIGWQSGRNNEKYIEVSNLQKEIQKRREGLDIVFCRKRGILFVSL